MFGTIVSVRAAISNHGIISPIFFEETVNQVRYKIMLKSSFIAHLMAKDLPMETQWFMQDGARPHTANTVLDYLHEMFDLRVMSHRFPEQHGCDKMWPPRSPDINPCDFFLWRFLKEKVYERRPENVVQLRALLVELRRALSEDFCRKLVTNNPLQLEASDVDTNTSYVMKVRLLLI
ncbi:hypothetical protein ANN_11840 [Periplaneta americana]|uniref:Tc1-like transposase DDE domain-containing protein n=1 Tax=Periplaneta americana TaxID=6978 RepID=A0ABQ8T7L7_PERAM|nr:hypothetical protein ANN_11840 [Periplaneta americana]